MLKMLSIKLRYWNLVAFFIWLSFKSQLSAVPTVHVIPALKDLAKGTIHPRQPTKTHRHSRCIDVHHTPATLAMVQTSAICIGSWMGPRVGLDWGGKSCRIWSPDCPSHSQLLYQLCYTKGLIKTQKSKFNFLTDSSILHLQLPAVCTVYIIWYLKCKTVQCLLV
jgi:hypothetical protein